MEEDCGRKGRDGEVLWKELIERVWEKRQRRE